MAELIGEKYLIIDQKGERSNVTQIADRSDRFVKKGLDRYYRLGFNFRFNGALPNKYGGMDQMATMIKDVSSRLSVTVRLGELAVDFADRNVFLAWTNPKGLLTVSPDYGEDRRAGLLHMYNERDGIGEFITPLYHSPNPDLDPIELLVHLAYNQQRLRSLLNRAQMEDEGYYRELREVVMPMAEFVDPK